MAAVRKAVYTGSGENEDTRVWSGAENQSSSPGSVSSCSCVALTKAPEVYLDEDEVLGGNQTRSYL